MELNKLEIQSLLGKAIELYNPEKNATMILGMKNISGSVVVAKSDLTGDINALYLKDISTDELSTAVDSKNMREALPKLTLDEYMFLNTGVTPIEALSNIAEAFKQASNDASKIKETFH